MHAFPIPAFVMVAGLPPVVTVATRFGAGGGPFGAVAGQGGRAAGEQRRFGDVSGRGCQYVDRNLRRTAPLQRQEHLCFPHGAGQRIFAVQQYRAGDSPGRKGLPMGSHFAGDQ